MDIFEHIMKEHQEIDQMLRQLASGASGKQELLSKLKLAVTAHVEGEESSIYPAMSENHHDFIAQATEEHLQVSRLMDTMVNAGVSDDSFSDNLSSLTNMIQSHVQKEESQMIPKARDMFDQDQISRLSQVFDEADNRIMQKAR